MFIFSATLANPCSVGFEACEASAWDQTFNDATGEFNGSAYSIALHACSAGLLACYNFLDQQ